MDMNVLQLSGKVKKGILHRFKTLKIIKYEETQPTIRLYLASNSSHRSLALNLAPFVTLPYQSRYYNSSWKKNFKYRLRKR